jgi:hypothetical protein
MRRGALAGLALLLAAAAPAAPGERPTFSVDYVVRLSRREPRRARVRWLLAGIEEIRRFRLVFRDNRITEVTGTGTLAWRGRTLIWTPGGPYAHLRYTVDVDHARPPGRGHDSWAAPDWVATRALHLFPETNVVFRSGADGARSRARLLFRLPRGWRSAAAQAPLGDDTYALDEPKTRFDRPRGWFLLGRIGIHRHAVAGTELTIAVAPGSRLDVGRLLALYGRTLPLLETLLGPPPPRLLLVSAPDPMWRGGLSGEDSFLVHGRIPVRSSDRTSSYLHELFHVWQPFQPADDARWVAEGLAEYYSLALQRRAGRLSERGFARGIALFARHGRWHVDLTRSQAAPALNNSAPLVMHALDRAIRRATGDRRSLDDAVRALAHGGGTVTTARFLGAVNGAGGRDFTRFFRRHVYRGEPPSADDGGPR